MASLQTDLTMTKGEISELEPAKEKVLKENKGLDLMSQKLLDARVAAVEQRKEDAWKLKKKGTPGR